MNTTDFNNLFNRRGYIEPNGIDTAVKNELPPVQFTDLMVNSVNAIIRGLNRNSKKRKSFEQNVSECVYLSKHFSINEKIAMAKVITKKFVESGWDNVFVSFNRNQLCVSIGDKMCRVYNIAGASYIVANAGMVDCIFESPEACKTCFKEFKFYI